MMNESVGNLVACRTRDWKCERDSTIVLAKATTTTAPVPRRLLNHDVLRPLDNLDPILHKQPQSVKSLLQEDASSLLVHQ